MVGILPGHTSSSGDVRLKIVCVDGGVVCVWVGVVCVCVDGGVVCVWVGVVCVCVCVCV